MNITYVTQLTIIPCDSTIIVNNHAKFGFDLSHLDKNIHAISWENGFGEIQYISHPETQRFYNESIESIEEYQSIIDMWENQVEEIPAPNLDVVQEEPQKELIIPPELEEQIKEINRKIKELNDI